MGKDIAGFKDAQTLAVDFGSYRTKAVGAVEDFGGMSISDVCAFNNPPEAVSSSVVAAPRKLGKLLASRLRDWGEKPRVGVFAVPSSSATLKWVKVPLVQGEELREAVRFKVKRHLPYDVAEAYVTASQPVPEDGTQTGMALAIAVPRAVVDSRAETLLYAGVEPISAELEAQAILRVIEKTLADRGPLWRDASVTVIDLGGSQTQMYVVQNRRLQFVHGVRFGADSIVQCVAQKLCVPTSQAAEQLVRPGTKLAADGFIELENREASERIDATEPLGRLANEFVRLLRYFRSLHPERSYAGVLEQAVACGGLAGLDGVPEYLQQSVGLRIERAVPFSPSVAQVESDTLQQHEVSQPEFTIVTGLALAGLRAGSEQTSIGNDETEFSWIRTA
jgi:type IV pilus assembly protein PilM